MNIFFYIIVALFVFCCVRIVVVEPYLLGFLLLLCSIVICFSVGLLSSSLMGLLVFIIYVGGLMVLFMYVLSVFPNEYYSFYYWKIGIIFISLVLSIFFCLTTDLGRSYGWFALTYRKVHCFHYISLKFCWDVFVFMAVFLLLIIIVVCFLVVKKRLPMRSVWFSS